MEKTCRRTRQPACGRQGARRPPGAGLGRRPVAGGYGHALGERTSGRVAGGHEGDGRGRWKRPFEFPILHETMAFPGVSSSVIYV